jgi:hypothetical protein
MCKRDYVCDLAFGGSLKSGIFCFGAFGKGQLSVAVKMFSHLIYFKDI